MPCDALLCATGLTRDYGPHRAVADVDLRIETGDVLGILGSNGAGKSTLLRMLAGTLSPTAGQICIAGHDLARASRSARRALGYLPERPPLYPELTVDEYLGFVARLQGLAGADRRAAVARAKTDTGLDAVGRRLIGQLSKGTAQRVGLAQAIVHRPQLLILDEPTSGLDPNQLRSVRELIGTLARAHAVILSSHLLSEVEAVASRVAIMAGGRIVLDAPRAALATGDGWFELALRATPGDAEIQRLPGVIAVHPLGPGRWQLRIEPTEAEACRADIAARVVQAGWGLHTLRPIHPSLETRFRALSATDTSQSLP